MSRESTGTLGTRPLPGQTVATAAVVGYFPYIRYQHSRSPRHPLSPSWRDRTSMRRGRSSAGRLGSGDVLRRSLGPADARQGAGSAAELRSGVPTRASIAIAVVVGCATPSDRIESMPSNTAGRPAIGCVPADAPPGAILEIRRIVLPIGKNAVDERGAVTHAGSCPEGIACRTVDERVIAKLWAELVLAAGIEHGPPVASPHYGGRWVKARWPGGSCELADSGQTPVAAPSAARFDAVFDAIAGALQSSP